MQVGEKERHAQVERIHNEVVDIVAGKLVDPKSKRVYTAGMIEKALEQLSSQGRNISRKIKGRGRVGRLRQRRRERRGRARRRNCRRGRGCNYKEYQKPGIGGDEGFDCVAAYTCVEGENEIEGHMSVEYIETGREKDSEEGGTGRWGGG